MLDVHMVTTHDMQAMKISESQASKLKNKADIKNPIYGSCSLERFSFDTRIFRRLFHPLSV